MSEGASEGDGREVRGDVARRHGGRWFLLVGLAAYVLLQAAFFPSYYAFADEGCYVSMAFVFARGRISADGLDMNLYRFSRIGDRLVGVHDHGLGWLLVPLTVFGPRALFAFNMIAHLAAFVVFWLLVRRLGLHPAFSLLYLLYPTFWYHSRNIVNDLPAGVCVLAAFTLLLVGGRALVASGFLMGLALFVRPAAAVFVAPFLLAWLVTALVELRSRRQPGGWRELWKKVGLLALGGGPLLVLLVLYNLLVMQSLLGLGEGRLGTPEVVPFALSHIPLNLLRYGIVLNLLYPGMLVLFFLYRGPMRWPLIVSLVTGGFFYMTCVHWGLGARVRFGRIESLVMGARYFEVVLPLMILAYVWVLQRLAGRFGKVFWVLFAVAASGLFVGDAAISFLHQRHMDRAAYFRDLLFDNTPKDALVLMDWPATTRISADITRPRRLLVGFPFRGEERSPEALDRQLRECGEGYVVELQTGGEAAVPAGTARDREAFVGRYRHETVLDAAKSGWRLRITRLRPDGPPTTPQLEREGAS